MVTRRSLLIGSAGLLVGGAAGCGSPTTTGATSTSAAGPTPTSGAASPMSASPTSASPTPRPDTASTSPSPSARATGKPDPKVAGTVADDLDVPWGIAFFANGDALVSERDRARLLRITPKGKVTPLGAVSGVQPATGIGEGGLMGIAFAPGDESTVFAYLTSSSDNRVVRLSLDGGRVGKPKAVLTGIPTSVHHHGGRLLFAPDGTLFVSTGDAEQSSLAQGKDSLAGKVLRIRTDGRAASGNPFGNRTWSYGHRNIEGLAFDASGRLWATEFGDKAADELNLIRKGRNYGWPEVEGRSDSYENPKATWTPTSSCSPAGLAITRSTAFTGALQGRCLFSVPLDGTDAGKPVAHFRNDYGRLRNVVVAPDGALWVTTSNTDGRVTPGRNDDKILRVTL